MPSIRQAVHTTHVGVYFEPSLGKMDYRRVMRYTFLDDCDYNDLCKEYRSYVNEQGRLRTLEEKAGKKSFRQRADRMCFRSQGNQNPGATQLRFL